MTKIYSEYYEEIIIDDKESFEVKLFAHGTIEDHGTGTELESERFEMILGEIEFHEPTLTIKENDCLRRFLRDNKKEIMTKLYEYADDDVKPEEPDDDYEPLRFDMYATKIR